MPPGFLRPDRAHDRGPGMRRRGLRLTRVETYVLTRTLIGVGGALGVLVAIVMLIDFVELSRTVGTNRFHTVTPADTLNLTHPRHPVEDDPAAALRLPVRGCWAPTST